MFSNYLTREAEKFFSTSRRTPEPSLQLRIQTVYFFKCLSLSLKSSLWLFLWRDANKVFLLCVTLKLNLERNHSALIATETPGSSHSSCLLLDLVTWPRQSPASSCGLRPLLADGQPLGLRCLTVQRNDTRVTHRMSADCYFNVSRQSQRLLETIWLFRKRNSWFCWKKLQWTVFMNGKLDFGRCNIYFNVDFFFFFFLHAFVLCNVMGTDGSIGHDKRCFFFFYNQPSACFLSSQTRFGAAIQQNGTNDSEDVENVSVRTTCILS